MSYADEVIFKESIDPVDESKNIFTEKRLLYAIDTNNGSYNGGQIQLDTSVFATNGKYMDFRNGYLEIPFQWQILSSADVTGQSPSPFMASIKDGFYQILSNITVDYNGVTIVQQTTNIAQYINFRVLSEWSTNDLKKYGPSCGVAPDTSTSGQYAVGASAWGNGVGNNRVFLGGTTLVNGAYVGQQWNDGLLQRCQNLSYSAAAAGGFSGLSAFNTTPNSTGMANFFLQANAGGAATQYVWQCMATIRLKDIHPYFAKVPLVKGGLYRFQINTNSGSVLVTSVAAGPTLAIANATHVTLGPTSTHVPVMMTSSVASNPMNGPVAGGAGATFTLSWGIGNLNNVSHFLNQVRLYVNAYVMDPAYEEQYLSLHPTQTIKYNDVQNFIYSNVAAGTAFQANIVQGVINPKSVVVIPQLNPTIVGNNATVLFAEQNSPFSSCPATTAFAVPLQNFQVQVAGINMFQTNQQYDFDQYQSEISKLGLNGGMVTSLSSGLLSQMDWQLMYRFYYCDVSRRLASDNTTSKYINIQGTNTSQKVIDLHCYIEYEREIVVQTATGALVV